MVFLIKYCLHCSITVDLLPWEQLKIYPVTTCNPRFIVSSNTGERDYGRGRKHSVVCTVSLPSPLLFQPRSPFVSLLRDRPKEGGKSKKGSPTARARAPPICDQLGSPSRMAKAARCRPLARRGWQRRPRRLRKGIEDAVASSSTVASHGNNHLAPPLSYMHAAELRIIIIIIECVLDNDDYGS